MCILRGRYALRTLSAVDTGLVRALGRWTLAALVVNSIIGSGVFGLPSVISRLLGPLAPWAWLVGAVGNGLVMLCFAEVASRFSGAGGAYLYAREALPRWLAMDRIGELGMACGYRFRIAAFEAGARASRVTVENTGVAPIYHDAWVAVNGVRAGESLKLLPPGQRRQFIVSAGGPQPVLTIEADRLVPGQVIGFDADLN